MRALEIARDAFSGVDPVTVATPATNRANACSPAMRQAATSCDTGAPDGPQGPGCRKMSQGVANPETRASTALSRVSRVSWGAVSQTPSQTRRDAALGRLLRWGWPPDLAAETADRIARRADDDDRRTCPECRHAAPGRCRNHRRADLRTPDAGRDLAALPQRCGGFEEMKP